MKAGKSSAVADTLPSRSTKRAASSNVSSAVAMPRTSSTNSMTGTGFMKWMPMKRSGRSVAAARRVIEIEEVLVASTVVGLQKRADLRVDLALDLLVLGGRLDHEVHVGQLVHVFRAVDALDGGLALGIARSGRTRPGGPCCR